MNRRHFLATLAGAPIVAKMAPAVTPEVRLTGGMNHYIAAHSWPTLTASTFSPTEKDFEEFLAYVLKHGPDR